jgi:hypothetical protein
VSLKLSEIIYFNTSNKTILRMDKSTIKKVRRVIEGQGNTEDEHKLKDAIDLLADGIPDVDKFTDSALKFAEQQEKTDSEFRDWYINQLTTCFGEELDALRKQSLQDSSFTGSAEDLSSLVTALRTGESEAIFEKLAKKAALHSIKPKRGKANGN